MDTQQFPLENLIDDLPRLTVMLSFCLNIPLISGWIYLQALCL